MRRPSSVVLIGLLGSFSGVAHGHGSVPESMGVVFERDEDAFPLVTTSFGVLVANSQEDWTWICEDLTGQTYGTLFEALPDGTWLFGATVGLWRSEDRCAWETPSELVGAFVSALHRDPEVEGRVWLTTSTTDADNGLWESEDSGQTWTLVVGPELLGEGVEVRGFVREGDAWALVGWRDELPYLWWSEDLESWTELPISDLPEDSSVLPLGIDPDEPGAVWLRYNGPTTDQLVHATTDGGFEVRLELSDNLLGFATGPEPGQLEVGGRTAGLHRSMDGGESWEQADYPEEVGCIVDHEGRRYICSNNWLDEGAVVEGEPGGDTWTPVVDFADVHEPLACASGTEAAEVCEPLWEGTRSFAGLDQSDPEAEETGSEPSKEEGCGCASGAGGGSIMAVLVTVAALSRRKRAGLATLIASALLAGCGGQTKDASGETGEEQVVTAFNLNYRTDPDPPVAGEPAELWYSILDQDGEPVENLQQNHQRMVHVIVLSEDLSSFEHKHHEDQNEITADDLRTATFHVGETFPYAGRYLMAFDYAYANEYKQSTTYQEVEGEVPQLDAPVEDLSTTVSVEGYTAEFSWEVDPIAGYEAHLWVYITDDEGNEITDMTQWLGADAHLVVVRDDISWITHTHAYVAGMENVPPDHDMPHEYTGPDLPFRYTFANAGTYKSWLQFAREGAPDDPVTIPFMFEVSP